MALNTVYVQNPKIYPMVATTDGLLVAGGTTIEVKASMLIPDIADTGFFITPKVELEKAVKKTESKSTEESSETGEN